MFLSTTDVLKRFCWNMVLLICYHTDFVVLSPQPPTQIFVVAVFPQEEPKKVRFDYDLFLHLEGHPPVNHLRCEKLTFNNPTEEFRKKLLKAGGVGIYCCLLMEHAQNQLLFVNIHNRF